jgi:type IX secretion system PorP/SprF family membrane protein
MKNQNLGMKKRLALFSIIVFAAFTVKGQRDLFNLQVINPAYAGSWNTTGVIATSNHRFVGIDGAEMAQVISFQSIIKSEKNGIGLNIVHQNIGSERRISAFANYSYQFRISKQSTLRLGINGGIMNYRNSLKELELYPDGISDPEFQSNINEYLPNLGVGLYLSSHKYYIGLSVPEFIESKYDPKSLSFYSAGGVIFEISDNLKIKPSFFTQSFSGKPFEYDFLTNLLVKEKFWIGGFYRSVKSTGAIVEWIGFKNLRIGYVFEYSLNDIESFQYGTHEFMLSYAMKDIFTKYF